MYAVIDTETTGMETTDQVVEIGVVLVGASGRRLAWSSLVRPTVPVQPGARAAHHITDEELADAPTPEQLLETFPLGLISECTMVAHNLRFDCRMLTQSGLGEIMPQRQVCTYQVSRHVWPEAPGYSNQTLRYWLGLEAPSVLLRPPHRAVSDALVTAALLEKLLTERDEEQLVTLTRSPVLLIKVTFGKYRGQLWSSIEDSYLQWILGCREPFDDDVRHTAKHWLEQRRKRA